MDNRAAAEEQLQSGFTNCFQKWDDSFFSGLFPLSFLFPALVHQFSASLTCSCLSHHCDDLQRSFSCLLLNPAGTYRERWTNREKGCGFVTDGSVKSVTDVESEWMKIDHHIWSFLVLIALKKKVQLWRLNYNQDDDVQKSTKSQLYSIMFVFSSRDPKMEKEGQENGRADVNFIDKT